MEYKANTPKANWLINYTILILSDQVREDIRGKVRKQYKSNRWKKLAQKK